MHNIYFSLNALKATSTNDISHHMLKVKGIVPIHHAHIVSRRAVWIQSLYTKGWMLFFLCHERWSKFKRKKRQSCYLRTVRNFDEFHFEMWYICDKNRDTTYVNSFHEFWCKQSWYTVVLPLRCKHSALNVLTHANFLKFANSSQIFVTDDYYQLDIIQPVSYVLMYLFGAYVTIKYIS